MKGLVTETKGRFVTVHIVRKEACGECRACLSGMMENDMDIEAQNLCEAEVGDWVELELQDNAFMHAILIMYGIPLVGLVLGLVHGYFVVAPLVPFINEGLTSFIVGAIFTAVCYLWIHSQNHRWESGKYRPLATKLVAEDEVEGACGA